MTSPPDQPEPPSLRETASTGPWRGPVFGYRGAEIRCNKGGHVCTLLMEDHPLHGMTFGVPGTVTPLIDLWVDKHRLPGYMRLVTKADE
jgi:hypothetical protein